MFSFSQKILDFIFIIYYDLSTPYKIEYSFFVRIYIYTVVALKLVQFYMKHDLSKDFLIISDVISSLAFKKCFIASAFVIFISGFFVISFLHKFLAFYFKIPLIKTSNG